MERVEVIQILAHTEAKKTQAVKLASHIDLKRESPVLKGLRVWIREGIESDICITLHWNSDSETRSKSELGLQLVEMFSQLGWINHSIWSRNNPETLKGE